MTYLQTTDHVEAFESVAEQGIAPKCSICKSIEVKYDLLIVAAIAITRFAFDLRKQQKEKLKCINFIRATNSAKCCK